jgi:hypothetical protein
VPPDLVVTNFDVQRDGAYWHLRLSGRPQPHGTIRDAVALESARTLLSNQLAGGPFHVRFERPGTNVASGIGSSAGPGGGATNVLSWLERLKTETRAEQTNLPAEFTLEGWIHP